MPKTTAVPASELPSSSAESNAELPNLEKEHVQKVYDAVAAQWHGTRYKAWPKVVDFVASLPPRSLVADLGCGNGKIAPHCQRLGHHAIGCDFSIELVRIAALQQGLEAQAADVMALPYRDGVFDAAMSIAVLHHVSTEARRRLLVSETLRVLRPGGRALLYAWAAEQSDGRSGHSFGDPDVFVPFHNRVHGATPPSATKVAASASPAADDADGGVAALEAMGGVYDESKRAVVFQRYCHVYRDGELRALIESVGGSTILDEYDDTGNHCILIQKLPVEGAGAAAAMDLTDPAPPPSVPPSPPSGPADEVEERPPPADQLVEWISKTDTLAIRILAALQDDGYIVLPQVLSASECAFELDRLWGYVERVSPGVHRDAPSTWYPSSDESSAPSDPWPHSGWKSFADMFQTHQAGWLFSELRVMLAERVFERLYGMRQLHSSKEGFTFYRPHASDGTHPIGGKPRYVCGEVSHNAGEHYDQGHAEVGLQSVQSSTCLIDQTTEDACFLCWPKSHQHHQRLTKSIWRGRSHWVPLTDAELQSLTDEYGLSPRRVPVNAGDVILWRSDLIHAAAPPLSPRHTFRAVSYTCMLPAALTPAKVVERKAEAYKHGHTTDHLPAREYWHTSKGDEMEWKPYFGDGVAPELTKRQAELYGLVPYGED